MGKYESRFISPAYRNLNLDSVRLRSNDTLINIEHHSEINKNLMIRNYEYCVSLYAASNKKVLPYIFYTGKPPIIKLGLINEPMFFNPRWYVTKEKNRTVRLNNIKLKNIKQEKLNAFEVLDMIWSPVFNREITMEDAIIEAVALYDQIDASQYLKNVLFRCLSLWSGRYLKDEDKLRYAEKVLNMSELKIKPFEEQYYGVIYAKKLEMAEEKGIKIGEERGIKKGEERGIKKGEKNNEDKFVKILLKTKTPEEISKEFGIPLERIQEIEKT